jgi:hypothetical protein
MYESVTGCTPIGGWFRWTIGFSLFGIRFSSSSTKSQILFATNIPQATRVATLRSSRVSNTNIAMVCAACTATAGRWQRDHQNYKKFSRLIERDALRAMFDAE